MRGRLLRRYKRFLVDIETETGEVVTAFCPATGRLRSCYRVGAPVEYTEAGSPSRRTDYDWWSIRMPESWVVIDTRPANDLLYRFHHKLDFPAEWRRVEWHPEPVIGEGRLDFKLETKPDPTWVEVKSVTWSEDGVGYFPDAPSERATRHVKSLIDVADRKHVALVLVTMRSDIREIRPAKYVDPVFYEHLLEAREAGVSIMGVRCSVSFREVEPSERIPVIL